MRLFSALILLALLLGGCAPGEASTPVYPTAIPTVLPRSATAVMVTAAAPTAASTPATTSTTRSTDTVVPTETVVSTETAVSTDTPAATGTPASTAAPTTQSDLAGLVYEIGGGNGVFVIENNGQPRLLTHQYLAALSPDLSQAAFSQDYDGELWLADLAAGAQNPRNLTQTGDVQESSFTWWPANPGWILFNTQGAASSGTAMMRSDGSSYQVIDQQGSFSAPAPAPKPGMVAFDRVGQPFLWRAEGGAESLAYNSAGLGIKKAIHPVWSPDGSQLAWQVYGGENPGWAAVGVLDLASKSWRLLHQYDRNAGGELFADLAWSPDGRWIAVVNQGERPPQGESQPSKAALPLWVLSADGSDEHFIGNGTDPVWSPTGEALVFTYQPAKSSSFQENRLMRVKMGDWQPDVLALPGGSTARLWVTLSH